MSSGMAHVNGITQFTCHPLYLSMCVCQFGTLLNLAKRLYRSRCSLKGRLIWAQETIIIWGNTLYLAIEFDWTSRTRRQPRCGLVKNYTDHLLLDCVVHRDVPVRHFDDPAGARSNATRRCLWHHLLSNAGFLQVTLVSGYCITSIGTRLRNFIPATLIR